MSSTEIFGNEELRRSWGECNMFLKDSELLTYRDWLEVEKDISLDWFSEKVEENLEDLVDVVDAYIKYA